MKNLPKPLSWDEVQDARRAETGMYVLIHEDFDNEVAAQANLQVMPQPKNCATPQFAQVCGFCL